MDLANHAWARKSPEKGEAGALQRGLAILEVLIDAATPMALSEIADATGLKGATLHRLLQDLVKLEYVVRQSGRRYMASPKAFLPLSLYHPLNLLRRDAYDLLQELRDEFQLTSSIVVFVGNERLVLDLAAANEMLSPYYETYLKSPLHAAASGKVLLMSLPEQRVSELLGADPYPSHTQATITDREQLTADLQQSRERGYAIAIDENYRGISAVAAPIRIHQESPIACFVLTGDTGRCLQHGVERIGATLKEKADLFAFGSPAVKLVRSFFGR